MFSLTDRVEPYDSSFGLSEISIQIFIEKFLEIKEISGLTGDRLAMLIRDYMKKFFAKVSWEGDFILISPVRKQDSITIYLKNIPWSHVIIDMTNMKIVSYGPHFPVIDSRILYSDNKLISDFSVFEIYDGVVIILRYIKDNIWGLSTMESIDGDKMWFNKLTRGQAFKECLELYPQSLAMFEFGEDDEGKLIIRSDSLDQATCYHLSMTHTLYNPISTNKLVFLSVANIVTGSIDRNNIFPDIPIQKTISNEELETIIDKPISTITIHDIKDYYYDNGDGVLIRGPLGDALIKSNRSLQLDRLLYDLKVTKINEESNEFSEYSLLKNINPTSYFNYSVFRTWCNIKLRTQLKVLLPDITSEMYPEFEAFKRKFVNSMVSEYNNTTKSTDSPKDKFSPINKFNNIVISFLVKYTIFDKNSPGIKPLNITKFKTALKYKNYSEINKMIFHITNTEKLYHALEGFRKM